MSSHRPRIKKQYFIAKSEAIKHIAVSSGFSSFVEGGPTERKDHKANILGVGIGPKVTNGFITSDVSIRIYVRRKLTIKELQNDVVEKEYASIPTDIIEISDVYPLRALETWQRFGSFRPTCCGVSVGHQGNTPGTLGCLVEKDGKRYILSNNHVIANENDAELGDPIIQPGPMDGGILPNDAIAILSEYKPLKFDSDPDANGVLERPNFMDAAIARIHEESEITRDIISIGRPQSNSFKKPRYFQSVIKHGRTSGLSMGIIKDLSVDVAIPYRKGRAWFENQIGIEGIGNAPFSQRGDSGSLIVDATSKLAVGLLFAKANGITLANPIAPILEEFSVSIA